MKKFLFSFAVMALCSMVSFAGKNNPLVGVWQKVEYRGPGIIMIGSAGKVFMPDGRLFGFYLNPADYNHYEDFDFNPWLFGNYEVTSDSTYHEKITLHQAGPQWETDAYFTYKFLNSRILLAEFTHVFPDGTKRAITDVWIKAVYDEKERKELLKKVADNWDEYMQRAKIIFGRMSYDDCPIR